MPPEIFRMKNKLSSSINSHSFPKIFFLFPFFLRLYHKAVYFTTLRNWYCKSAINKALPLNNTKFSLLDAGCGAGDYLIPLAKKFPNSILTGIDHAKSNIDVSRNYTEKKRITNCLFINDDLERVNLNSKFDVVICITVLQYIENDFDLLVKFNSLLTPGGKLLLYSPVNYISFFSFYKKLQANAKAANYDQIHGIKRRYTERVICDKIIKAGFKISSKKFSYGTFGKIAFEVHSVFLSLIQSISILLVPLVAVVYFLSVFPAVLLLNIIDYLMENITGNGIFITAIKEK